ncbi:GNAT family N-acetyltransferase [Arthrobacter sp. TB 26]|uniref:GNAT family N-acetyltransferase n=1 Tax=Arthrobacter sp. TB 26 TaxID=494420 RepID=UPI000A0419F5|nr:GNAT family N-acetyltransferase [Arthrobacter sp. TB 26]
MSTADRTFRPAAPADFPAVASLLNLAYATVGVNPGETANTVKERYENALVLVLEVRGILAGTLTIARSGSCYGRLARPGQMEVSRLAVARAHQGRGVGKAMLTGTAELCRREGVQALVGATLERMTTAHQLYESIGAKRGVIPGIKARGYTLDLTHETEN